jgi:hypothetical protein
MKEVKNQFLDLNNNYIEADGTSSFYLSNDVFVASV